VDEKTANTKMNEAREHLHAAHENMHKVAEAMIPEGMREHQREARKEFLPKSFCLGFAVYWMLPSSTQKNNPSNRARAAKHKGMGKPCLCVFKTV